MRRARDLCRDGQCAFRAGRAIKWNQNMLKHDRTPFFPDRRYRRPGYSVSVQSICHFPLKEITVERLFLTIMTQPADKHMLLAPIRTPAAERFLLQGVRVAYRANQFFHRGGWRSDQPLWHDVPVCSIEEVFLHVVIL